MVYDSKIAAELVPVREGLVHCGDDDRHAIGLLGSQCAECEEVSIGTNDVCLNCGGDSIRSIRLSSAGRLWTYTVVRHRPPGDYLGPDPFEPFALGLVELPEGVRVMAPLEGDIESFHVDADVVLTSWILTAADGTAYCAFKFALSGG